MTTETPKRELRHPLALTRERLQDCNPSVTERGLWVENAAEALFAAELLLEGGLKGFENRDRSPNPVALALAIMAGRSMGMGADQAAKSFAVINGRVSMYGDAMIAHVRNSRELAEHVETMSGEIDKNTRAATCKVVRVQKLVDGSFGRTTYTSTFSQEDARLAGLWNKDGPWRNYPDRMLTMRARAFCLRNAFADVLMGMGMYEEVRDYDEPAAAGDAPPREQNGSRVEGLAARLNGSVAHEDDEPIDTTATEQPDTELYNDLTDGADPPFNESDLEADDFGNEIASQMPDT